jgi:hypothetical protein
MNIYDFIYAYFYNKAEYPGPGRLAGSSHVLFALFSHVLLLIEVVYCLTGYKTHLFPETISGSLFHRKQVYFLYCIPFFIISWLFYNKKRTKKIIEKFDNRDEYVMQRDTNRVILYIVVPFLAALLLVFLKQKGII